MQFLTCLLCECSNSSIKTRAETEDSSACSNSSLKPRNRHSKPSNHLGSNFESSAFEALSRKPCKPISLL